MIWYLARTFALTKTRQQAMRPLFILVIIMGGSIRVLQSSLASYEDITFTNAATGVMVEGSTRSFPETCQLQVDVNSDQVFFSSPDMEDAGLEETQKQTYYEAFSGLAADGKCVVYTLTMTDAAGNDLSKGDVVDAAKIILPIPEAWKVTADQKLNVLAYSILPAPICLN